MKKHLDELLKRRGITLSQLSKESGVPKANLYAWETQKSVNLQQLKAVANTLKVTVHELAFGEADPFGSFAPEFLEEIFSGDVRVTLHRIDKKNSK